MAYVEFYHYTDTFGKDAIVDSGYILEKPAGDRHAHYGPGTYGTSLAPSEGLRRIAENNWKSHWMSNINNGKMDWAIVVDIPFRFVMEYGAEEGRDILVYNGRLYLDDYCYDVRVNLQPTVNKAMAYVEFHHYTDTCGRDAILESGYILEKPAGHKHAHFGPGAYGTSLAPSEGLRKIAENNWKNHWLSNINNGKMDWAIVVDIPFRFVMEYGAEQGRDILVYNGRLYLDDYCYDVVRGPTF